MRTFLRRLLGPAAPRAAGPSPVPVVVATWPGRLLVTGLLLKLLTSLTGTSVTILTVLDRAGAVALVVGGGGLGYHLFQLARRRLLWRVRNKLIVSYVFIGVVPVALAVVFFLVCGLLLFFNISSYLVQARLADLADQARFHARTTALEIQRSRTEGAQAVFLRRFSAVQARFPGASMALIPTVGDPPCGVGGGDAADALDQATSGQTPTFIGPWTHVQPPRRLPRWVGCDGFGGLLVYRSNRETADAHLLVRAVGLPDGPSPAWAVTLDVPVDEASVATLREDTGIQIGAIAIVRSEGEVAVRPLEGLDEGEPVRGASTIAIDSNLPSWVAILGFTEWDRGLNGQLTLNMGVHLGNMYTLLASAQGRNYWLRDFLLLFVGVVGTLFLVIEAAALVMGLALARSITGSVHELFEGTERVRQGDFSHKIAVVTRDQLGELADSFNSMTGSIEGFLREMEKKKRLEEELRIAREIQMSLLPQGPLRIAGLSVAALCVPAREVGGDYYDLLPLGGHRTGILIADVAGKGTSAALYMAELKGLVLALSQAYASPRQLLIRADRILAANLDSRSFITMTYAVVDTKARTMTYARAGHTPLIHVPASPDGERRARVLTPDGMVLGLRFDRGERFAQMLEEVTVPLVAGDLFVFFTDGISEAMNEHADCFGEGRLGRLVEDHGHLPSEELRERILQEIHRFVGAADQHDDMTMILIRVEERVSARDEVDVPTDVDVSLASVRGGA